MLVRKNQSHVWSRLTTFKQWMNVATFTECFGVRLSPAACQVKLWFQNVFYNPLIFSIYANILIHVLIWKLHPILGEIPCFAQVAQFYLSSGHVSNFWSRIWRSSMILKQASLVLRHWYQCWFMGMVGGPTSGMSWWWHNSNQCCQREPGKVL